MIGILIMVAILLGSLLSEWESKRTNTYGASSEEQRSRDIWNWASPDERRLLLSARESADWPVDSDLLNREFNDLPALVGIEVNYNLRLTSDLGRNESGDRRV